MKYEHLIGTPFRYGSTDCLGLFRRFYSDNFGIEIADYARPHEWWKHGLDLFNDIYFQEGFRLIDVPLSKLRPADAIFMALDSRVANHCAVYVGGSKILHHVWSQFSNVAPLRGEFRNHITHLVRHKDIPDQTEAETKVDIMDHLLPHKRRLLEEALASNRTTT